MSIPSSAVKRRYRSPSPGASSSSDLLSSPLASPMKRMRCSPMSPGMTVRRKAAPLSPDAKALMDRVRLGKSSPSGRVLSSTSATSSVTAITLSPYKSQSPSSIFSPNKRSISSAKDIMMLEDESAGVYTGRSRNVSASGSESDGLDIVEEDALIKACSPTKLLQLQVSPSQSRVRQALKNIHPSPFPSRKIVAKQIRAQPLAVPTAAEKTPKAKAREDVLELPSKYHTLLTTHASIELLLAQHLSLNSLPPPQTHAHSEHHTTYAPLLSLPELVHRMASIGRTFSTSLLAQLLHVWSHKGSNRDSEVLESNLFVVPTRCQKTKANTYAVGMVVPKSWPSSEVALLFAQHLEMRRHRVDKVLRDHVHTHYVAYSCGLSKSSPSVVHGNGNTWPEPFLQSLKPPHQADLPSLPVAKALPAGPSTPKNKSRVRSSLSCRKGNEDDDLPIFEAEAQDVFGTPKMIKAPKASMMTPTSANLISPSKLSTVERKASLLERIRAKSSPACSPSRGDARFMAPSATLTRRSLLSRLPTCAKTLWWLFFAPIPGTPSRRRARPLKMDTALEAIMKGHEGGQGTSRAEAQQAMKLLIEIVPGFLSVDNWGPGEDWLALKGHGIAASASSGSNGMSLAEVIEQIQIELDK